MDIAACMDFPWVALGDFNEMTSQTEKWEGRPISKTRTDLFNKTLSDCNLIDLGFHGPKFTWSNNRKHAPIHERLDRGCANDLWFNKFPNTAIHHLPKITSDHCPLLLNLDHPNTFHGIKPFRFEPMWVLESSFTEVVYQAWFSRFLLDEKLDQTRNDLSVWNKEKFGNVYHHKKRALNRLRGIEKFLQDHPDSLLHLKLQEEIQSELVSILDQEEVLWLTKSRMEWVTKGERNTSFFHKSVQIKRQKSRILALDNNVGETITDPKLVREHIRDFFL